MQGQSDWDEGQQTLHELAFSGYKIEVAMAETRAKYCLINYFLYLSQLLKINRQKAVTRPIAANNPHIKSGCCISFAIAV
nr:hypothetical protein [uncultured Undibacterium sp.]